jgi:transcriptional regulator with XRE-family HTH domain
MKSRKHPVVRRRPNDRKPKPVDIFVGHRLRTARLATRVSQQSLADALKVTRQQAQKYENGTDRLSVSRLYAAAKLLGRDVGWFFPPDESTAPPRVDKFSELASAAGGLRLTDAYLAISDAKQRAVIVNLVEAFVEKNSA